jgi:hypothetical protein
MWGVWDAWDVFTSNRIEWFLVMLGCWLMYNLSQSPPVPYCDDINDYKEDSDFEISDEPPNSSDDDDTVIGDELCGCWDDWHCSINGKLELLPGCACPIHDTTHKSKTV